MSTTSFDAALAARVTAAANIAVIVLDEADKAEPLAEALLAGGVTVMELTLRTPAALEAIRRVKTRVPGMTVGAGTVLTPDQLRQAHDAGAAFAVSPGLNADVVRAARALGFSFAPGIMTPSEIEQAVGLGCTLLKYFPAEAMGGLATLTSMAAPYKHLDLRYIPLGGLKAENTRAYLQSPLIAACGGSWICTPKQIAAADWDSVRVNATMATRIARDARA